MTSKLKCPVCQNELRQLFNRYTGEPNCDYECGNLDCELYGIEIPESVWKAVIQKLEDLKIAKNGLHRVITKTNSQVVRGFEYIAAGIVKVAKDTLKQIEHKDEK